MIASFSTTVLAVDQRTDLLRPNAKNFSHPTVIDNKWMPLKPGMQFNYEGVTVDDEGKRVPWGVIQIVTDLVKNINGIDTVVIWVMALLCYVALYFEWLRKIVEFFGNVRIPGKVTIPFRRK